MSEKCYRCGQPREQVGIIKQWKSADLDEKAISAFVGLFFLAGFLTITLGTIAVVIEMASGI